MDSNLLISTFVLMLTYQQVQSIHYFEKLNHSASENNSCPALKNETNLIVHCNNSNLVGSLCQFTCNGSNLVLNGSANIRCGQNGQWNSTEPQCMSSSSWEGFVGAIVAVVFFGSNFIPVKKFETGDGMFFQWVLCSAIWITGLVVNCLNGFPQFYPLAMLGGFLWATGNICVVPIIKTIGLGLGMLIWGSFNLLAGWTSGRFGWFGLQPEIPNDTTLNYIAIGFAMTRALLFISVDNSAEMGNADKKDADLYYTAVNSNKQSGDDEELIDSSGATSSLSWEEKMSPKSKRILGATLSVLSGVFYGLSFTPVIYVKENYKDAPQHDIDYVFAHFSGIYATSTFYFIVYCMFKKNKPMIYPSAILPGMISGVMWAIADACWFIANNYLSEAISFPIITTGPGIVASLWGVLLFREVKGCKNYIVMAVAYTFTITGAVLAGLSKK